MVTFEYLQTNIFVVVKTTQRYLLLLLVKDYPLVLMLKMLIGGSIRHKVENHAYVLTISSISGLINVIGLINGYLRTPKIARFNQLIQWVNNKTGDSIV